jgi:hypothetical protein
MCARQFRIPVLIEPLLQLNFSISSAVRLASRRTNGHRLTSVCACVVFPSFKKPRCYRLRLVARSFTFVMRQRWCLFAVPGHWVVDASWHERTPAPSPGQCMCMSYRRRSVTRGGMHRGSDTRCCNLHEIFEVRITGRVGAHFRCTPERAAALFLHTDQPGVEEIRRNEQGCFDSECRSRSEGTQQRLVLLLSWRE